MRSVQFILRYSRMVAAFAPRVAASAEYGCRHPHPGRSALSDLRIHHGFWHLLRSLEELLDFPRHRALGCFMSHVAILRGCLSVASFSSGASQRCGSRAEGCPLIYFTKAAFDGVPVHAEPRVWKREEDKLDRAAAGSWQN